MAWELLPQEETGDYLFRGHPILSEMFTKMLSAYDIAQLTKKLYDFIQQNRNAHYKQIFKNTMSDITVLAIDTQGEDITKLHCMHYSKNVEPVKGDIAWITIREYQEGLTSAS